jgi:hypothetical protein
MKYGPLNEATSEIRLLTIRPFYRSGCLITSKSTQILVAIRFVSLCCASYGNSILLVYILVGFIIERSGDSPRQVLS